MATRKKTPVERRPESQRDPRRETRDAALSGRAPAAPPVAGLSSAILQLPRRFTQPRISLSASLPATIEHIHPAPVRGNISRIPEAPVSKHPTVRQRFGELRDALADGFEIVQPIFARPLWTTPDDSATAFNFVLTRERTTRLVIVPEGRTIQRFIRERNLAVDYRR
ncbi:MAG TPA: hypothetical protein VKQ30_06185 [Ktedonobacterales bacterium]|nr:hypothetical protein [Ktedonobacterales bacterium]